MAPADGVISPVTVRQREAFIATAIAAQQESVAARCYGDLLREYEGRLASDLSQDRRRVAGEVLNDFISKSFETQMESYAALADYVRSEPDLSTAKTASPKKGHIGSLEIGVDDVAVWGVGAKVARVHFFLDYTKWTRLAEAKAREREAQAALRPFLRPDPGESAYNQGKVPINKAEKR